MADSKQLKITYVHSAIGRSETQKKTIEALGLSKLGQSVIKTDTPALRGMLAKVSHLVEVEEV
ncbi:MAG: 50S ribosomal protein L30 [Firmicutes bacterium]|nr:50S ribosomal protein L30 [Bacillota bacterium]